MIPDYNCHSSAFSLMQKSGDLRTGKSLMQIWKHAKDVRRYKLTAGTVFLLIGLSIYAAFIMVQEGYYYWSSFFGAQSSSVIFFSLVFVGVAVQLSKRMVPDLETFSIALATTLSAIWFYELIYHYSFISYFNYFRFPYFQFSDANTLVMDCALSLLIVAGHRHMRLRRNYLLWISISLFMILYGFWLIIGFPQYADRTFQLPVLIAVEDPFGTAFFLGRISKLSLCISWVFLYAGPPSQQFRTYSGRPSIEVERTLRTGECGERLEHSSQ
jgi:hypothetical protein